MALETTNSQGYWLWIFTLTLILVWAITASWVALIVTCAVAVGLYLLINWKRENTRRRFVLREIEFQKHS